MSSDPYSAIIGGLLGTASSIVQAIGFDKQAKAEEEAAQAAALLAREQALVESAASRRQARRATGLQRAKVARSGVSLQGSQIDLLISNAWEMELEAVMIERFGAEAARQHETRAKSIGKAAQLGRAAGAIQTFRTAGSAGYQAFGQSFNTGGGSTNPQMARQVASNAGRAASESRARLNELMNTPLGPSGGR